jgi:AcrR family transcriptional regulator
VGRRADSTPRPSRSRMADSALVNVQLDGRLREIVDRAAELFDKHGYHNVTMEDIADAVGVRKPTLYYYVKSRDQILFLIHQEFMDLVIERDEVRKRSALPPSETILEIMSDILELMATHRGHVRVFFEHYRELPKRFQAAIHRKRDYYERVVEDVIRAGVASGEFRAVEPRLATLALFGMCNWAYQWYRREGALGTREIASAFWKILLGGISSGTPAQRQRPSTTKMDRAFAPSVGPPDPGSD